MGFLRSIRKAIHPAFARNARNNSAQPVMRPVSETEIYQSLANPAALASVPLPRDSMDLSQFGPMHALDLRPIDAVRRDSGRPEPRITEYEVGENLILEGQREIPWRILRDAARNVDLLRRCIEIRKNRITALDWGWTVSDEAVEVAIDGDKTKSKEDVETELRKAMQGEIGRLTEFWHKPWKGNQFGFKQWVSALLEEFLVLDAVAVYPRMNYGGEVLDFEVLDGSTIKVLRDWRGATPTAPYPAYQQVLYGFPRGEFTATVERDENGQRIPNAYQSDQLYYYRNVPRVHTPYGLSPVEQALISARLYLKRQGWMMSEYDDGVLPLVYFVPPEAATAALGEQFTPSRRREWESAMNDELSGNTRTRHRGKVTPPGWDVVMPNDVSEKYKPDYDMYLIRIMAAHMGVTVPSLNLQDSGGLGSTGYHEGLADIEYRNATLPTVQSLEEIINTLSHTYLGAPKELCFKFLGLDSEDEESADETIQSRLESGRITLNESRDAIGKPRYSFKEADMPMLYTQRGMVMIEGASETAQPGVTIGALQANDKAPDQEDEQDSNSPPQASGKPTTNDKPKAAVGDAASREMLMKSEAAAYHRWLRKTDPKKRGRAFNFTSMTALEAMSQGVIKFDDVGVLATFKAGEPNPKASGGQEPPENAQEWPGWDADQAIVAFWVPVIIAALGATGIGSKLLSALRLSPPPRDSSPDQLIHWIERAGVTSQVISDALTDALEGIWTDGYYVGVVAGNAMVTGSAAAAKKALADWKAGDPEAAKLLLGELGDGSGLADMLRQDRAWIKEISDTLMRDLAKILARGLEQGLSYDEIARELTDLLEDAEHARMIAVTETSRAVSHATLNRYKAASVRQVAWSTSLDDRVCPICGANEADSPAPTGTPFPSGDLQPPAHPYCRCALLPLFM